MNPQEIINGLQGPSKPNREMAADCIEQLREWPSEQERAKALETWRRQMLAVESQWNVQRVGELCGVKIGEDIRPAIEPFIRAQQARIAELQQQAELKSGKIIDGKAFVLSAEVFDAMKAQDERQKARIAELEAQASVGARAVCVDRDLLVDRIAEALSGTYHCTRAWSAWGYGTMSQSDFCDVGESETPGEIADMVIAILRDAAKQNGGE